MSETSQILSITVVIFPVGFQQHNILQHQRGNDERADAWGMCVFDLLNLKDFQARRDGKKQTQWTKNTQSSSVLCPGNWQSFLPAPPPPRPPVFLSANLGLIRDSSWGTGRVLGLQIVSKPNLLALGYSSRLIGEDLPPCTGTNIAGSKHTRWFMLGNIIVMQTAVRTVWDDTFLD